MMGDLGITGILSMVSKAEEYMPEVLRLGLKLHQSQAINYILVLVGSGSTLHLDPCRAHFR